jgi:ferredoxin
MIKLLQFRLRAFSTTPNPIRFSILDNND